MRKLTFTVHDCGCVDLDNHGDDDGFHLMAVAWFLMLKLNEMVEIDSFQDSEFILETTLEAMKRSPICVTHIQKNAN